MGQHEISADDLSERIAERAAVHDTDADDPPDGVVWNIDRPWRDPQASGNLRVTSRSLEDHKRHPSRVHMAWNQELSLCGARPTFVWTYDRSIAEKSGNACPHCLDLGIDTTRLPELPPMLRRRIRDAFGRFLPKHLRD